MIRQNIGILNALLRITCGLTFLSYATAKMVRKSRDQSNMVLAVLAAMKVAEGIVRYCPVTAVVTNYMDTMDNNNSDSTKDSGQNQNTTFEQKQDEAINPS